MMLIKLSPQVRDDTLIVFKSGDVLTINGQAFDFTNLPEGAVLPRDAVDCEFLVSDVTRQAGQIVLTLLLPLGPDAPEEARFPAPITVTEDGPVRLPTEIHVGPENGPEGEP